MDPYDSDSTGLEDEGDYTDTGVLLGYASKEAVDDNISHLGGWPVCQVISILHHMHGKHLIPADCDMCIHVDMARRQYPASGPPG